MNDDIYLGAFREPQAQKKTQPCVDCGRPVEIVGSRCQECLQKAWWRETLGRQVKFAGDAREVELMADTRKRIHIPLFDRRRISFCMLKLPGEGRYQKACADELPAGVCELCRRVFEKVRKGEIGQ